MAGAVVVLGAVTSPYWVPRRLLGDDTFDAGYFARYPYRAELDGFVVPEYDDLEREIPWLREDRYAWLLRIRGECVTDFDDLSRIGGQVLLDTACRVGIDTEVYHHRENLPLDREDRLWTGDWNVVYRFAQSPKLQMRSGAGFNWLSDRSRRDFGFNFTYGGDWFVRQPWILSAEIDWGWLGKASLFHGRATVGVHYHRLEVYTGYDYYDVGRAQTGGLVGGLRLWY